METRELGGLAVSAIGLGCLGMSGGYGAADPAECVTAIRHAVARGVSLVDTADFYGDGENERLVGRAVAPCRGEVVVATRGGVRATRPNGPPVVVDGSPASLRGACDGSLRRLGVDRIDLYYLARVDPRVPVEESVGALAELRAAGKIDHIGLSEATPEALRRAAAIHPISALETEYSLWERHVEYAVLPEARALGIALVAHTPLGKGFLAGRVRTSGDLGPRDHRRNHPRFQDGNLRRNRLLTIDAERLAAAAGATTAQLALAWLLARGPDIVPIPGSRRTAHIDENIAATGLRLSPADLAALDGVFAPGRVWGGRQPLNR